MTEISTLAYNKIVLHAMKYPYAAVRGFLLGKRLRDQPPIVVDAIPALHGAVLAPILEILLITLDTYCHDNGLKIVGIYFANVRPSDSTFDEVFGKVAEKLVTTNQDPAPIALQVDNSKLRINAEEPCLTAYTLENKQWRPTTCFLPNEEIGTASVAEAIEGKFYRELVDFENHLDNPSLDVFNAHLNAKIKQLIENETS